MHTYKHTHTYLLLTMLQQEIHTHMYCTHIVETLRIHNYIILTYTQKQVFVTKNYLLPMCVIINKYVLLKPSDVQNM